MGCGMKLTKGQTAALQVLTEHADVGVPSHHWTGIDPWGDASVNTQAAENLVTQGLARRELHHGGWLYFPTPAGFVALDQNQ